uniref:Uncharacterized protein n=1 Tax=Solanum tuberosum TaxID=4113 RepID=M1A392_SOLTU
MIVPDTGDGIRERLGRRDVWGREKVERSSFFFLEKEERIEVTFLEKMKAVNMIFGKKKENREVLGRTILGKAEKS